MTLLENIFSWQYRIILKKLFNSNLNSVKVATGKQNSVAATTSLKIPELAKVYSLWLSFGQVLD
jgi:hypothetical protein